MKILLVEASIYGHHLEYIHHIYQWMERYPDYHLDLVLPYEFEKEKEKYQWKDLDNITITFIPQEIIDGIIASSGIKKPWKMIQMLRNYVKDKQPDVVFMMRIMSFMPFLLFMIPKNILLYGIIYKIYLYHWKSLSWQKKFLNILFYYSLKLCSNLRKVYILNDKSAASFLNRKYHTDKFVFLPDPINEYPYKGNSLREKLNISNDDIVFLHFGAMDSRKGTIELLDSIKYLLPNSKKDKVFIFAGVVQEDIKAEFYKKIESLKQECRIILFDSFLNNEHIADLCVTTDYFVCPYKVTDLSSGVIGYAAAYRKRLIGPSDGLIGKLIRKYKLGICVEEIRPELLSKALNQSSKDGMSSQSYYSFSHSISSFCEVTFNFFAD